MVKCCAPLQHITPISRIGSNAIIVTLIWYDLYKEI